MMSDRAAGEAVRGSVDAAASPNAASGGAKSSNSREGSASGQGPALGQGLVRACAYCKEDKPWVYSGKKLKDGSKVYVDGKGQRWAGRRCPECERARVYAAVRCDGFDRDIILKQFTDAGYEIVSRTLPLKVKKDGETFSVVIKRAYADGGRVVLETPVEAGHDLVALVFESVRICTTDQLARMTPNLGVHQT